MYEVVLSETPLGEVHALDAHGNDLLATVEGKKSCCRKFRWC